MTKWVFNIRRVAPNDIEAVVGLCAEHAAYEQTAYDTRGKREHLEAALFSDMPSLYAWVIDDYKRLVGYATATREFSTWDAAFFLHMDCLYLREEVRGRGLGRALIAEVAREAIFLGCVNMQWQTPSWNELAISFYERIGAEAKQKLRFYLCGQTLENLARTDSSLTY